MATNNPNQAPPTEHPPLPASQGENQALPPMVEPEPVKQEQPQQEAAPRTRRQGTPADTPTAKTKVHQLVLEREPGDEDKEEIEDLKQQKLAGDFSGEYGKRVYCKRYNRSLAPLRCIFMLGGRFPFSTILQSDGTYMYKFHFFYPLGLHFLLSTGVMFYTVFFGFLNVLHITLNITLSKNDQTEQYQMQREYEDVLIRRYYIPLIFVFSSLIHGCIASVFMIIKRNYIAHYLTFWSK